MMADHPFIADDERAHPPDPDPDWEEAWYFDFVSAAGSLAGYARLGLRPADGRAWWWAAVVGDALPFVLVRDHDVDLPRPGSLEIRGSGLWAEPFCETPLEHWSMGLEAFAVGLDDPVEAYGAERGDPLPLGLDLGWEGEGDLAPVPGGYRQTCGVHGEVLVGRQRWVVNGTGTREHTWGRRDWGTGRDWAAGRLDDGTPVGTVVELATDGRGLLAGGTADGHRLEPVAHAPVQVPRPGAAPACLARALCRVVAGDGRQGWAWAERAQPASNTIG